MKGKILIATPVDYTNFGNRLQNFAVHSFCYENGLDPVTLAVDYSFFCKILPKHVLLPVLHFFGIGTFFLKKTNFKSINKSLAGWKFTKQKIRTIYVKNNKQYIRLVKKAQFFGIGGDQIFSPFWHKIVWFATFPLADPNKKICFGPSIGANLVPEGYLVELVEELSGIENIAVREESGCSLLNAHLSKKVIRICDPVVLLTREKWCGLLRKDPIKKSTPFLLVYFLGHFSPEYIDFVHQICEDKHLVLIDISDYSTSHEASCSPIEFLGMLYEAEYVFTDSFHGILLSLIFNKKMVIFDRIGGLQMSTRITELINRYRIENCLYKGSTTKNPLLGLYDFDFVNKILDQERKDGLNYIKKFKI